MPRPTANEYPPFYAGYINATKGESIKDLMSNHADAIRKMYNDIPADKADHAYAEGKWTIKELVQHVIDSERVFVYRALRFSRKDELPLQGFEENSYIKNSFASERSFATLMDEFNALRTSTDLFVQSLQEEQLLQKGVANGKEITVNAIVFIIYGHLLHHLKVVQERYLNVQ